MNRLTERNEQGAAYVAMADTLPERDQEIEGSKKLLEAIYAIFQKLAAYEDTGLEPEEIDKLKSIDNYCKVMEEQSARDREELKKYMDLVEQGSLTNLNSFAEDVHELAIEKGWWSEEKSFGDIIALCHSELSEALEEYRNGKPYIYFKEINGFEVSEISVLNDEKPEGIAIELADCIIRILDYCGNEGIDIEQAIQIKHNYNKGRQYKHGGKKL